MFNKSLALLSLLLATGSVTAELRGKKTNVVVNNVIHSKKDATDVIKNIPINVVRTLNSETCEKETGDLMKNQGIMDVVANTPSSGFCSIANAKVICDNKDVFPILETACDNAGGQFFEYSLTMDGEGISMLHKNLAVCIGASCDKEAALMVQEEHFSPNSYDEVIVKESGASSETCESETLDLRKNQDIMDAVANAPSSLTDYASNSFCSISNSNSKVTCDYKDVFTTLETACDNAGGQFLEYSLTMEGDGLSVFHENLAECIGASCDKDAALKAQEEHFSTFTALGYDAVTAKESGASSLSSALVAMIALTGVVGTLV
ncbi:predicted protein [Chaetoceros tenuissimus]|uniref:Uncharacterized protein n=1 Tax=Chaetoceros tenuissimus TaxID=426638 RepID=A0AAD3H1Z8_9STRA|nr:predicted protein [Chaetoceros tenuissimus]